MMVCDHDITAIDSPVIPDPENVYGHFTTTRD